MIDNNKAVLGAIGENVVISKLLEHGWVAFNVNSTIKNFKSIDLVCIRMEEGTWKHKSVLVQVKTLKRHKPNAKLNFPTGFDIFSSKDKTYLDVNIKGPYVFVVANPSETGYIFEYYILSRNQMKELLYESNKWYISWERENPIKEKGVTAGLLLHWIEGYGDKAVKGRMEFVNPLAKHKSCKDNWNNIENE
ncbi:MAG: hypothetical protein M0Q90_03640 [Bacteroidales bacterium]|nr:hypothetical protein [Bacteroidales bacterium]